MKVIGIEYFEAERCLMVDDNPEKQEMPPINSEFKIQAYHPEAYFNEFKKNGFLTTHFAYCALESRIFFFNSDVTQFSTHILDYILPKITKLRTGYNDLEVILKLKTFTSHYIDWDINYLVFYDELFEEKNLNFSYHLLKVYEGNELWQKKELSQEDFPVFRPINERDFDLYFIYEIILETGETFTTSFTVTTPKALTDNYQKRLSTGKSYELSYPFFLMTIFDFKTILVYIEYVFEQIKASSKHELMLKLSTIMSVENIDAILTEPLGKGEILSFKLIIKDTKTY